MSALSVYTFVIVIVYRCLVMLSSSVHRLVLLHARTRVCFYLNTTTFEVEVHTLSTTHGKRCRCCCGRYCCACGCDVVVAGVVVVIDRC